MTIFGLPNISSMTTQASNAKPTTIIAPDVKGFGSELVMKNGIQVQKMYIHASNFAYFPKVINLKADKKTTLTITTHHVIGCAKVMFLQGLYDKPIPLNQEKINVSFTPKKGKYYISCTMGMVTPIVVNVF